MAYTQVKAFRKWFGRIGHKIVADYWRKELNKPSKLWKKVKGKIAEIRIKGEEE